MGPGQAVLHALAGALGMHPAPGERVLLVFQYFPSGGFGMLAVLGLLALFLAGLWSLRALARDFPAWARRAAGAARGTALALPLLLLLGPALVIEKEKKLPGSVLVLVDSSWSMNQKDPGAPLSRAGLLNRFLSDEKTRFFDRLARKNNLRVLAFDRSVRPVPPAEGGTWPGVRPKGRATNLTAALQAVLEGERSGRVAAALVFTDGRWNEGGDPAEAARALGARHIPLHLVGVGNPATPLSIRITGIDAPERAFLGDPFSLEFRLQGPPGLGEVEALLTDRLPGGKEETVRTERVPLGPGGRGKATFLVRPGKPGVHTYSLAVRPAGPGKALAAAEKVVVEVGTLPARVLLVAGGPSWEYRRLRKLLTRDPTIDLSCWLQSAGPGYPQEGNHPIRALPAGEEDLKPFHAVLLLDPDPGKLNLLFSSSLEKAVRQEGTGLLYQAGEIHSLRFFSTSVKAALTAPLAGLLPARADQSVAEILVGMGKAMTRAWPVEPTPAGLKDRLLALGDGPENTRGILSSLPGLYWNYPFRAPSPGAHVLLVHPGSGPLHRTAQGPRPLFAWQYAGAGRVALLAFDGTWRWATFSEKTWERFWIRLVRFLSEPRLLGDKTVHRLFTDKGVYEAGVEILLFDRPPRGERPGKLQVRVKREGGEALTLTLLPDQAEGGELQTRFTLWKPGLYEASLPGRKGSRTARFAVRPPALEVFGPMAEKTLKELARRAGGTYRPLEKASGLPDLVEEASETLVTQSPPRPLWDNWIFLVFVVVLLSFEWILRKWMNLP